MVEPTIASCIHRITHRTTDGRHGCVDNAVGLDNQLQYARQPDVQSKVDVISAPPAMAAEATLQVEHWSNIARSRETDRENGYDRRILATSDALLSCTTGHALETLRPQESQVIPALICTRHFGPTKLWLARRFGTHYQTRFDLKLSRVTILGVIIKLISSLSTNILST